MGIEPKSKNLVAGDSLKSNATRILTKGSSENIIVFGNYLHEIMKCRLKTIFLHNRFVATVKKCSLLRQSSRLACNHFTTIELLKTVNIMPQACGQITFFQIYFELTLKIRHRLASYFWAKIGVKDYILQIWPYFVLKLSYIQTCSLDIVTEP